MEKERLDILVQRQTGVARAQAQGLIRTGRVRAQDGRLLDKPGVRLPVETMFQIDEGARYVSRGGQKLEAALAAFKLDVTGAVAIDAGASTGGFTDCLLQHGAARVYAVDVGYGQLAWTLRQDARVVVLERVNARTLDPAGLPETPTVATVDVSFISLTLVLPAVAAAVAPGGTIVALVKPQFEVARDAVGKGGVVRDPVARAAAVARVGAAAAALGLAVAGTAESVLPGPKGNREVFLRLHRARAS